MQTRKAFYLLLFLLCPILKLSAQAVNEKDSLALVDLYNNTNGPSWKVQGNWLMAPVRLWRGVTISGNRVTEIRLPSNNLSGYIPSSIANMNQLSTLILNNNQLSGHIPPALGNLTNLQTFNLGNNNINGNIPGSLGKLSNLIHLVLDSNGITGHIPAEFANLYALQELLLNHNSLTGDVSMLADLPLQRLNLSYNEFTFDGLESVATSFKGITLIYRKQARLTVHQNGNSFSVSAGGTLKNNKYVWLTADNLDSTVIKGDSVFHPKKAGTYRVRIVNSKAMHLILRSVMFTYTAPVDSIPKNDKSKEFTVYPNPVKNIINVKNIGSATYTLLDQTGRVILIKNITDNGTIDFSNFVIGMYYLRNNSTGVVKKIMKYDYK